MDEIVINHAEDILKLKDIQSMMKLFRQWGIKQPKTDNKDVLVNELVAFYNTNGTFEPTVPKRTGGAVLKEALKSHHGNREKLMKLYDKVLQFYKQLPLNFQQDLNSIFPGMERTAQRMRTELAAPACYILVAGEATAGKSSLINLLLECDILPTADIKCTQTICEIRKSSDNQKYAHCFGVNGGQKTKIDLHTKEGKERLAYCISYEDEYGDSPFDKIEIYWPTDVIEEGFVIVDTPGFGDSQMNRSLKNYLSKSCGFLYVVNTANAGGVQKGRLKDFLRNVVNSSDEDFSPSSTLFVCNKWDRVPTQDREEIKRRTVYQLDQIYQGLRPEQIFYFSTTEAKRAFKFNTVDSAHEDLISNGLQRLFLNSLRQQLNYHYRWLSQIVKRANYTLKVSKTMEAVGKEEMTQNMEDIKRNMNALEEKSRLTIEDLKKGLQFEIGALHKTIADVLRSRELINILTDWTQPECPSSGDYKKVAKEVAEIIASKMSSELNKWERNHGIICTIKDKMVKKFQRDCELLEDQITEIEGTLVGENLRDKKAINDLHTTMKKQVKKKKIWKKAKKNDPEDDVRGLGGAVVSSCSAISGNRKFKNVFKGYNKNNNTIKMSEATIVFIDSIFEGNVLIGKISGFLKKLLKGVDEIAKKIPEFLKADKRLLEQISKDMKETDEHLKKMYPELIRAGYDNQGELDLFFVFYILEMDYRLSDLEWDRTHLLGRGTFGDVYKGRLKTAETHVALKYCKDPLSERVVSDVLLEDRTLRELKHENIITYHGCTIQQGGKARKQKHWIMIMEYCDDTLKGKFICEEYKNSGKLGDDYARQVEQMEELAFYGKQICNGLDYLHKKKLVHRDMKLENILIVKRENQDVIKLTDVGLTKRENSITGTVLGTPVYMAPEVHTPMGIYDRKSDIYALGIMIWEMWYGIDAATYIQDQLYTTIEKAVCEEGLRPSLTLKDKPDDNWQGLMKSCWNKDPKARPEASDVKSFFDNFLH